MVDNRLSLHLGKTECILVGTERGKEGGQCAVSGGDVGWEFKREGSGNGGS